MKDANIDNVLKKSEEFESEGKIQELFLDQKIRLTNATVGNGKMGKFARIYLEDVKGKAHKVHTSSGVLVSQIEDLLENGLGEVAYPCTLTQKKSKDGRMYLSFNA
jgi:hypothetical protein